MDLQCKRNFGVDVTSHEIELDLKFIRRITVFVGETEMSEKRKYTRLSESSWAEVRALWEVGDSTLEELSARFGVTKRTLQAHFARHRISKGSKSRELAAAVETEVFRRELSDKETLVERAKEIRERTFTNAKAIEGLVMAQLERAQEEPALAYKAGTAVKMLALAAAALERLHDLKRSALGLDKETVQPEELPVLIFRDLSREDLDEIEASHEKWGDDDITCSTEHRSDPGPDGDRDEEEDEVVEIRPDDPDNPASTIEGCRLVRGAL